MRDEASCGMMIPDLFLPMCIRRRLEASRQIEMTTSEITLRAHKKSRSRQFRCRENILEGVDLGRETDLTLIEMTEEAPGIPNLCGDPIKSHLKLFHGATNSNHPDRRRRQMMTTLRPSLATRQRDGINIALPAFPRSVNGAVQHHRLQLHPTHALLLRPLQRNRSSGDTVKSSLRFPRWR